MNQVRFNLNIGYFKLLELELSSIYFTECEKNSHLLLAFKGIMKIRKNRSHGKESCDFRILQMANYCQSPLIQVSDLNRGVLTIIFDISVNTDQIGMWFKEDTLENYSNMSIFSDFQTKIWLKSY